ncbi:hypothetical protein JTB14_027200 [Gonioctena quinquepunctata]|nr:hypothetical protein JTB14_027200 [Gonioctena quinquepunctata]
MSNSTKFKIFSGSGKSTFLGAISGRLKNKQGTVKINDKEISNKDLCNISGHVQQEDIFTETLTILELMEFTVRNLRHEAALKLNKTEKERSAKIKKLLIDLGLDANKHTVIQMLSGGGRRRLSLATECENKLKTLITKYREICDHNNKTGNERKTWKFFKQLEEYIGDKPNVRPAGKCSSLGLATSSSSPSTSSVTGTDVQK